MNINKTIIYLSFIIFVSFAYAEPETNNPQEKTTNITSPWIFTPLISVNPKLSASAGALAAYMHKFDEQSSASMFGVMGNYSETESWTSVAFAKVYFDQNKQRISTAFAKGKINNDYDDYLGTGIPLKTTDNLNMFVVRYTHQIWSNWHIGAQMQNAIYGIEGATEGSNYILNTAGLDGFDAVGLGLVIEYDSKDKQRSATKGQYALLKNTTYRKSLGGSQSFDSYIGQYTYYFSHGANNVLAINAQGRWTHNAPPSGYSSVYTKAYTRGQYLAPHTTSIEFDERISLNNHWGISVYGGLTCLYGNTNTENISCSDSANLYPSGAAGVIYALKPKQGIVIRAEFAKGKGDNQSFYLSFGQPF